MNKGDRLILKRGKREVVAVGVAVERDGVVNGVAGRSGADRNWLHDYDGWDMPGFCCVEWHRPDAPRVVAGLGRRAVERLDRPDIYCVADDILRSTDPLTVEPEPGPTAPVGVEEMLDHLIRLGVRSAVAEELTGTLERVKLLALKSLGSPEISVRSAGKLGDDLIYGRNSTGQRFVSIPAFTKNNEGRVGMLRRQCTTEYKIETVNRAIRRELLGLQPRQRVPKDVIVHQYFGISTDEAARAERAKKRFAGIKHTVPHWPLIEMGWSRKGCVEYLRDQLPYPMPKSSCVFCPFKTNQSWQHLKQTDPAGWNRAVEIDAALRDKDSVATRGFRQQLYVHRSCVPLPLIDFDALTPNTLDPMATGECHGMCGI